MKKQCFTLFILGMIVFNPLHSQNAVRIDNSQIKTAINENIPVYRIELRLVTANGEWDGTDNEVYVQLNSNDDYFFLDYGRDDFNRNADQRFDIISKHIVSIKDIDFIKLGVRRNDQWGIKKVELYLNNSPQPVFSKTYTPQIVINKKAGQHEQFIISSVNLRSNASWLNIPKNQALSAQPVPVNFPMIKSIVESVVGDQLHHSADSHLQWGSTDDKNTVWGDWVEGNYVTSNTLHFDLDLEYAIPNSPDAEIDVDFDLVFKCENGKIIIKTENVKTGCQFLGISCQKIENVVNRVLDFIGVDPVDFGLQDHGNNFTRIFTINSGDHRCSGIIVGGGGDVVVF